MFHQALKTQNRYLTGLLEKAAANTVERDVADRIQSVLTEELHHRMKNMLAVVTAIVRQSMRNASTMANAERAITTRLIAMASAHDLLLRADWKTASLHAVILGAIAQHDTDSSRIVLVGDEMEIVSTTIVPMTLLLNELCTNATKYGALSKEGGQVILTWNRDEVEGSTTFRWIERGGPAIVSPVAGKNLGTRLIEDALPRQFGGKGRLSFPPEGAEFELSLPTKNIAAPRDL